MKKRRKHIDWDYNYDGMFYKERYTKFDKRYWNKWIRKNGKKEIEIQTQEETNASVV